MDLRVGIPERAVKHEVLDAALEVPTRLNEVLIRNGDVPPWPEALARGVRWRPEPPGAERFDHAGTVLSRGWGDCDDLAPYAVASLRASGEDPTAQSVVMRTGPHRWHAVVLRSDGSIEDPSVDAGMLQRRGAQAAAMPTMQESSVVGGYAIARPRIALAGDPNGGFRARAEIPLFPDDDDDPDPGDGYDDDDDHQGDGDGGGDGGGGGDTPQAPTGKKPGAPKMRRPGAPKRHKPHAPPPRRPHAPTSHPMSRLQHSLMMHRIRGAESPFGWTAISRAHSPRRALSNAIIGCVVGAEVCGWTDEEHVERLLSIAGMLEGIPIEDLAEVFGDDHAEAAARVGFDFGQMFHDIAPIVSKGLQFIPGVGPVASTALDVATQFIPSGGGGGGGSAPRAMPVMRRGGIVAPQGPIQRVPAAPTVQPGGYGVCITPDQIARAIARFVQT